MAVCLFVSLVLPLRASRQSKAVLGILLLAVSLKYLFYELVGGSFFRPDLPLAVLLAAEALYSSLVILFFLALIKDAAGLLLRLGRLAGVNCHLPFSPAARGAFLLALALTSGLWGSYQPVRVPDVKTVEITIPNLQAELEGFSIVQLSDIHIGPVQKKEWLNKVVKKVNEIKADAIVITGDSIDGLPAELRRDVQPLERLWLYFKKRGKRKSGGHSVMFSPAYPQRTRTRKR